MKTVIMVLLAAAAWPLNAQPTRGPVPPCGAEAFPAFPLLGAEPAVTYWRPEDVPKDWAFPACVPLPNRRFDSMVTTAGRFQHSGGADALLRRVGTISALKGVRYWSASKKEWRTLIEDARAASTPKGGEPRGDFAPEELIPGATVYFRQKDNTAGDLVFKMQVMESSQDRVVLHVENAGSLKKLFMTLLRAGEMESLYVFDRESADVWSFYSIMRVSDGASGLVSGKPESAINRSVAFFRHFAGIQTDKEPPAAR